MRLYSRDYWNKNQPSDLGASDCNFCDKIKGSEYIIWKGEHFQIRHNKYPFLGREGHLLAVPNRHVKFTKDLTIQEFGELKLVEEFISNYYEGKEYFSFIRQSFANRSMEHLHYHYLEGKMSSSTLENMLEKQGFEKIER